MSKQDADTAMPQSQVSDEQAPGFLSRWSKRKRDAAAQTSSLQDETGPSSAGFSIPLGEHSHAIARADTSSSADSTVRSKPPEQSPVFSEQDSDTQERVLTDADMPPIESLDADSHLGVFFNKGVSAALRKAALRHVFRQSQFNVRDGLNDYDGDYTVFEPLGNTVTADMKFHIARKEADRLAEEASASSAEELSAQAQVTDATEEEKCVDHSAAIEEGEGNDQSIHSDESVSEADEALEDRPSTEADSKNNAIASTTEADSGNNAIASTMLVDSDDVLPEHAAADVEPIKPR